MLKTIVEVSPVQGSKTLSVLYRHIVGDPCPKAAADTFREAPWAAGDLRINLRGSLVRTAFDIAEAEGAPRAFFLSLDDSPTDCSFAFSSRKRPIVTCSSLPGWHLKQLSARKAMCVVELKAEKAQIGQVGAGAKVKRARTSVRSRVFRTIL